MKYYNEDGAPLHPTQFNNLNRIPNTINVLSKDAIANIYKRFAEGKSSKASLARLFDVSSDTITRAIENGESYHKSIVKTVLDTTFGYGAAKLLDKLNPTSPKNGLFATQSEVSDLCEDNYTIPKRVKSPIQVDLDLTPKPEYVYTITNNAVTIIDSTKNPSVIYNCDNSHNKFVEIKEAILNDDMELAINLISPKMNLINFSRGLIAVKNSEVYYKNQLICNNLTKIILEKVANKESDYERLINFMSKLMQNPSNKAVNRLYDFMRHNDIKVLKDGTILTLKAVRSDYMDLYSNSVLNRPGSTVSMERWMVDDNDNRTCSHGYHVGSVEYVRNYGGPDSVYLTCIVDPAHVVSIPVDHSDMKCRVSEYYIDKEFTREEVESGEYLKNYE